MRINLCLLALIVATLAAIGGECGETRSTPHVRGMTKEPDQVRIAMEHRVENRGPRCFWSVMETLGRHNRIKQLYGISNVFKDAPERADVPGFLHRYRLRHEMQWEGNYDTAILKRGCDRGLGVAICISYYIDTPQGSMEQAHMMTLVSYTKNYVRFIDPNKPGKVQQADHQWFRKYWDGWSIILYPN